MKIKDIISERHVPVVVAHDPKEAEKKFLKANKGKAGKDHDVRSALKRVRARYDVEIIGDAGNYLGHSGKKTSDKKDSLLTNRKKKS